MPRPPIGRLVALLCVMLISLGAIFVRLTVLQVSQAADLFADRIAVLVEEDYAAMNLCGTNPFAVYRMNLAHRGREFSRESLS